MANCVVCGSSNVGTSRVTLVLVDFNWYCATCLPSYKGAVKCSRCGKEPFRSGEHFKTVNGEYLCTTCLEEDGVQSKYEYVIEAASALRGRPSTQRTAAPSLSFRAPAASQPVTGQATSVKTSLPGSLQMLLDEHLRPGESVTVAAAGNAGEGLASTSRAVYILKSGMALGSITGRKCTTIPWDQITDITIKGGSLYGLLQIAGRKLPEHDPSDIMKAKKADNAVTFLASRKDEFTDVANLLQRNLSGRPSSLSFHP